MSVLEIIAAVVWSVAGAILGGCLVDPYRENRAYHRAMRKDAEYAKRHPGCSWEDAHRNRERYYRMRGM